MTSTELSEAAGRLSELAHKAEDGEYVVLTENGRPVATIVSVSDAHELARLEDEADVTAAKAAQAEGTYFSLEEVETYCHRLDEARASGDSEAETRILSELD